MSHPVFYVPAGDVLPIMFSTYAGATGASVTMTGLAVTDIEIYKDGSVTQRASDSGYTLLDTDGIDFDGITGIHGFSIDTGDNTDSGFYTVGAWFHVVVSAITVDSQTVSFIAAAFRLMPAEGIAGHPKVDVGGWLGTACATPTVAGVPEVDMTHLDGSAVSTAGSVPLLGIVDQGTAQAATGTTLQLRAAAAFANDEIVGAVVAITGGSTGVGQSRTITDYDASTDTATVDAWTTTPSGTITYKIFAAPPADSTGAQIKAVTDKLNTMLELTSGSPGEYEFTADSLRNAPSGPGGGGSADFTEGERVVIVTAAGALLTMIEPASGSPGEYMLTEDSVRKVAAVVPTALQNADTLLARDIGSGSNAGASEERTVRSALRFLRNKWAIVAGTLTVRKEDDTTAAWTAAVSTTSGADPVTGNDPT